MTPIWIFPAYPLLLIAPFAGSLIAALPDAAAAARINSVAIAFGAICIQGTGFLVSMMIYSAFIYRLMTQKLPRERTRPGMVRPLISFNRGLLLTPYLVCFCRTKWLHSRWYCSSRKHCNAKNHARRIYGKHGSGTHLQNTFRRGRALDVGAMLLVFPC